MHTALLAIIGTGTFVLALERIEFIVDCYHKILFTPGISGTDIIASIHPHDCGKYCKYY